MAQRIKGEGTAGYQLKSRLANSGRIAGIGMIEDYYGDGRFDDRNAPLGEMVRMPNDDALKDRKKWEAMNGPVIIVQEGKPKNEMQS